MIARFQAQIDTAREKEINRANAYARQLMIEAEAEAAEKAEAERKARVAREKAEAERKAAEEKALAHANSPEGAAARLDAEFAAARAAAEKAVAEKAAKGPAPSIAPEDK